jgi:hypothetical protein
MRTLSGFSLSTLFALALAGSACSSNNPATPQDAQTDTGAVTDASDVKVFVGPGTLRLTWTVHGMPPAMGCAVANGATVRIQPGFALPTEIPCTTGEFTIMSAMAGQYGIGADLLDSSGMTIYRYVAPVNVRSNETTDNNIAFDPPGSLAIRWTINGGTARSGCASVGGVDVRVKIDNVDQRQVTQCATGRVVFSNLQPTSHRLEVTLTKEADRPGFVTNLRTVNGEATVPSAASVDFDVDFMAPELPRDQ